MILVNTRGDFAIQWPTTPCNI